MLKVLGRRAEFSGKDTHPQGLPVHLEGTRGAPILEATFIK
jgi:hypothetical protein